MIVVSRRTQPDTLEQIFFLRSLFSVSHRYRNIRWADTHCPREDGNKPSCGLIRATLPNIPLMWRAGCYRSEFAQVKKLSENEDWASFPTSSCSGFIVTHLTWVIWSHLSTALRKWHPVSSRWTPKVRKRVTSHKVPRALKREGRFWGISETVMDFSIFKTIEDMISETENFFLHIELLSSLYSDASVPKFNEKLLSWEKHYKHCLL